MLEESDIILNYILPRIKRNILKSTELDNIYKYLLEVKLEPYIIQSKNIFSESFTYSNTLLFTSEKIKKIINSYQNNHIYIIKFNITTVKISFFSNEDIKNNKFILEIIRYIQFILSIYPVNKETINITYFLTDEKKYFENKIPDKNSVNSGSCSSFGNESNIHIWRKEEIMKVTLHEMIHALELDNYSDSFEIIKNYREKYNITSEKLNTNEAYTEIWANILNCFLISQRSLNDKKKTFNKLVTIEKFYSLFQAQKILTLFTKNKVDLDKNTNVTSYFLIRSELYQNLNQFLKFCRLNNKNYVKLLDEKEWLKFLKERNKINKKKISFKKNNYMNKNLRMTILNLDIPI